MPEGHETHDSFEDVFADCVDRLNAGRGIDKNEVRALHPEYAELLIERLESYERLAGELGSDDCLGTLGDYTLRRQIGRGGMGVVYEAWQNSVERRVALKVLPGAVAVDDRAFQRFMREARTAAQLSHPNIVGVHAMGQEDNTPYFAMELVEGQTLARILRMLKETEPDGDTDFGKKDQVGYFANLANVLADVADGLQHAHSKRVIHRDIKPSNLILGSGNRLRILDFGLARLEGQESLTFSGDVIGTPTYMSPEQAKRKKIPVDYRTDIYSLGATMYETLTGQPPFSGKDHADTLSQIIERDVRPPRQLNARVPTDLETIVLKCLRKDPSDRYATAEALAQDFRRFVRGYPIEAQAQSLWEKTRRRLWRQRRIAVAMSLILIVVVFALVVSNVLIARARDEARYDLYVSNMRLAMEDWRVGNSTRFVALLEEHVPEDGEADRRSWEWYYVDGLRCKALFTLGGHKRRVNSVDWNPNGEWIASGGDDGTVRLWSVLKRRVKDADGEASVWRSGPSARLEPGRGATGRRRCGWFGEDLGVELGRGSTRVGGRQERG